MPSKTQQLKDLADLLDRGLLTRTEFDQEKDRILGGPPSTHSIPAVPDPEEVEPAKPDSVGSYNILETRTVDALGAVYSARHSIEAVAERQGGDVLLRVVHPDLASAEGYLERVKGEANPGLKLQHAGIADVMSSTLEEGLVAVAARPVDGRRLSDIISAGPIDPIQAVALARNVIEAIAYAHSRGVVHGGLGPDAIVVRPDGSSVVFDLGLAKPSGRDLAARGGSIDFVPPELDQSTEADDRADVWSIGLLLYRMVTGRLPWPTGADPTTVQTVKASGDLPGHDALGAAADVVLQATRTDPDARFSSVAKLDEALAAIPWADAIRAEVAPAEAAPAAPEPAPAAPEPAPPEPAVVSPEPEVLPPMSLSSEEEVDPAAETVDAAAGLRAAAPGGHIELDLDEADAAPAPPPPPAPEPPTEPTVPAAPTAPSEDEDEDEDGKKKKKKKKKKEKKKGSCFLQGCMGCATLVLLLMIGAGITVWKVGLDEVFCQAAEQADQPDVWEKYLERYPVGKCADQANRALGRKSDKPEPVTADPNVEEPPTGDEAIPGEETPAVEADPETATAAESTPAPREESTPPPREETTPAPRTESTPAPRTESTPAPRTERTPAPREESTPAPRTESTPAPAANTEGPSDSIIGMIVSNNAPIKRCIRSERDRGRDVPGTLQVKFTINPDGAASRARVITDGWSGTSLDTCVSGQVNKLSFPPWDGDRKKVTYSLPTN